MKDFRTLQIWERGHQLTLAIYKITKRFPKEEMYGLISQIRRSSSSIPTNIAEGCGRFGDPELARFLQIAVGSASETEYHLLLSRDLGFIQDAEYQTLNEQLNELKRMIISFLQKIRSQKD